MSYQANISYNEQRAKYLLSALHKFIRRSKVFEAMQAGLELVLMAEHLFWSEIKTIAVEDVGQPAEIVAVDVLFRQFKEMKGDDMFGKGRLWVMRACEILALAEKDRTPDEFLHLLTRKPKEAGEFLEGWEDYRDAIEDMHTFEGKAKHRGYEHFVTVASRCDRMSTFYNYWTRRWVEIMTGKREDGL